VNLVTYGIHRRFPSERHRLASILHVRLTSAGDFVSLNLYRAVRSIRRRTGENLMPLGEIRFDDALQHMLDRFEK